MTKQELISELKLAFKSFIFIISVIAAVYFLVATSSVEPIDHEYSQEK